MTYNEERSDKEYLDALTDEWQIVEQIKEKIGGSHQGIKARLNALTSEGKALRDRIPSSGKYGFKYAWKINPDYKEPESGVLYIERDREIEAQGLLVWNRGRKLNEKKFRQYIEDCKAIIEASGIPLEDKEGQKPTVSFDAVRFKPVADDTSDKFYVPRELDPAEECIPAEREQRCFSHCKTDNKPYTVVAVACLVALKEIFPRTVLDLRCEYDLILDGVVLAEKVIGAVDRKYLLRKNIAFPEKAKVQKGVKKWKKEFQAKKELQVKS